MRTGTTTEVTGSSDGTFPMPNYPVTCTYTNTRTQNLVTLRKAWVNGFTGDQAVLTIAGGVTNPATATSTAPDAVTANNATTQVRSGERVTVSEVLPAGNTGTYTTELVCTGGVVPNAQGQFPMPDEPVVCTFTNTRTQNLVTLRKAWVNGFIGDQAVLTIAGGVTNPATATSTAPDLVTANNATTQVRSGERVTVSEVLPAGNTGTYTTELVCTGGVVPNAQGQFPMPDEPVVCTITNDRTENPVTLQKAWVNGFKGDTADLTIKGGLKDPVTNQSTATGGSGYELDDVNVALTDVFSGDDVSISEILAGQSAYVSGWECSVVSEQPARAEALDAPFSEGGEGLTGSFTMPDEPVVCTFTNIRKSHEVKLQKAWVNARGGDTAALTIKGGLPESGAPNKTSTATGATGTILDTTNVANSTVQVGDTVTVTEVLGASNAGKYGTTLACTAGEVKVTVDEKGNFQMPDAAVTCTFTNDRTTVVPTQPTVTAEICDPNVPGAQLPGSITIPANPDYAYFIDGVATAAGTYPKPAGSYKVTAQLIVTKPVSASALQQLAAQDVFTWTVVVPGSPVCPILTKESSAGNGSVITGQTVGYTITAKNGGDTAVVGETLVDTLPAGVDLITSSINPSNGVYNATARTITWKFDLPAAVGTTPATATFTYQVTVTASSGSIVNSVSWVERSLTATTTNPVTPGTVGGVEETPDEPDNVVGGSEDLPPTGADNTVNVAGFGLLAMVLGALMVGFGRRRRREQ